MSTSAPPVARSRHSFQLISNHSVDSSPALLVTFEHAKYLFNVPENTSRICVSSRTALKRVKTVFLDQLESSVGLPGVILTSVEAGNDKLEIVGPKGTDHLLASCRFFTRRDQLSLKVTQPLSMYEPSSVLPPPITADANLTVQAFPLWSSTSRPTLKRKRSSSPSSSTDKAAVSYDPASPTFRPSDLTGSHAAHWRQRVIGDMFKGRHFLPSDAPVPTALRPSPSYLQQPLPAYETPTPTEAYSYFGRGQQSRGKFLPEKAKALGVPTGKFGVLTKGQKVWVLKKKDGEGLEELPKSMGKAERRRILEERKKNADRVVDGEGDGVWIDPSDCMEPQPDATSFLVLNIPSPSYLDSLIVYPSWAFTSTPSTQLTHVYYLLGPSVLSDPRLQMYIDSFASNSPKPIEHLICSPETSGDPITFHGSTSLTSRLALMSPSIFPLPYSSAGTLSLPSDLPSTTSLAVVEPLPPSPPTPSEVYKDAVALLASPSTDDLPPPSAASQPGHDLLVTALGTGSAIPSKYRNVSSTLLHLPLVDGREQAYVLLDAGEGTYGQLARRFGPQGVQDVLRGLKVVFISHMHQDHHAGLVTILKRRLALEGRPKEPLVIVAPPQTRMYLFEQQQLFDLGLGARRDIHFIDNWALEPGKALEQGDRRVEQVKELYERLGLEKIEAVPVLHRCRCWGAVIVDKSGWKVVFSGDTMPCDALVEAGKGATLLIHEATIEDGLEEVAAAKGHSTFGQAIDIARRMEATYVLLTHFSARYPKLPPLNHAPPPVVVLAFDLMTLRLDQFWRAQKFKGALDALFGTAEGSMNGVLEVEDEDGFYCSSACQQAKWSKHSFSCSELPIGQDALQPAFVLDQQEVKELDEEVATVERLVRRAVGSLEGGEEFTPQLKELLEHPLPPFLGDPLPRPKKSAQSPYTPLSRSLCRLYLLHSVSHSTAKSFFPANLAQIIKVAKPPNLYAPKILARPGKLSGGEYDELLTVAAMLNCDEDGESPKEGRWMQLGILARLLPA